MKANVIALNEENSNFQNSPLVVPVFYKIGLRNTSAGNLYYPISERNDISFQVNLEQDQILELQMEEERIIPEQRAYNSFATITTGNEINRAGNYRVILENQPIAFISFSFDQADYGTIGLESVYGALNKKLDQATLIKLLTTGYKVFLKDSPKIEVGAAANLTFFTNEGSYTQERKQLKSTSKNSLFIGMKMK